MKNTKKVLHLIDTAVLSGPGKTIANSCKFINTSIAIGTNYQIYVYSVIIIDSTIGNSEKSITLNGKFELTDFLLPSNKINDFLS